MTKRLCGSDLYPLRMNFMLKSKLDCHCNNGDLGKDILGKTVWCQECNWEVTCQSEHCDSEDTGDNGYCEECEFEHSVDAADRAYDEAMDK